MKTGEKKKSSVPSPPTILHDASNAIQGLSFFLPKQVVFPTCDGPSEGEYVTFAHFDCAPLSSIIRRDVHPNDKDAATVRRERLNYNIFC